MEREDDDIAEGNRPRGEDEAGQNPRHPEEDSGYRRGRHRWQYPDKYHDPKRRRGNQSNNAAFTPPVNRPQNNPFSAGSGRLPNPFSGQQGARNPNGPFLPGTGRFLPPLERKLLFPFKGGPQHRSFPWGLGGNPSSGGVETQEEKESALVHAFQSPPPPPPSNQGSWNNSHQHHHQQQRRRGYGGRQRSRNRGRNPFDGFVPQERGSEEDGEEGVNQPPPNQGRSRYTWYNPNSNSGVNLENGSQDNPHQGRGRQGFHKYHNQGSGLYLPPHRQSSPPEKSTDVFTTPPTREEHITPTTTPMET